MQIPPATEPTEFPKDGIRIVRGFIQPKIGEAMGKGMLELLKK